MKNNMIKIVALLVSMAFIFAGCNMVEVNEEREIVAKIDDIIVTKTDYNALYNSFVMYGYIPEDLNTNPEYSDLRETYGQIMLDQLVDEKVLEMKAKENGCFDFTTEEQTKIDEKVNEIVEIYAGMYAVELGEDTANESKTEEELEAMALENIDEYLVEFNTSKQAIRLDYESSTAQEIFYELITKDIAITEDEVKAEYDQKVEAQKIGFEDGSLQFETISTDGSTLYYVVEGARQAQHILIQLPQEAQEEMAALQSNDDEEGYEAKLAESLLGIETAANAAYSRAFAGEDFGILIDELGEDPGMSSENHYILTNPTAKYTPEFAEGLFALANVGDISKPVATAYGYHIIKYYGDMESGPVPYDTLHDDLYETLLSDRKDGHFSDQMEIWKETIDIKTYIKRVID